jgi:hypothetical protein
MTQAVRQIANMKDTREGISELPKKRIRPTVPQAEQPGASVWKEFFDFVRRIDIPKDWMKERPMNRIPTKDRTLFREDD